MRKERVSSIGPLSRAGCESLRRYEAPGINTLLGDEPSLIWREASGSTVVDLDGNSYIDLTSGFGVASVGHRHPRVVAAVVEQAGELLHGLGDVAAHPRRLLLAQTLCETVPVDDPVLYFAISGSDAVEIALKTALLSTGRPGILAFDGGYHGLSLGSLAVTSRARFREPFRAHLHPHVARLPFAAPMEAVAAILRSAPIGAVLVEPVLGREGVIPPPPGWLSDLTLAARHAGALLIADEIFTGFGKTGSWFAVDEDRVRPDLLCCGKALGGGLPIAAVAGRRDLMAAWKNDGEARHTGTFVAHPLACAAALATLQVLRDENLVARAERLGREIVAPRLAAVLRRHPGAVSARRGRGLLWGLELRAGLEGAALGASLRRRGVLALASGEGGRVLQLVPPLSIPEDDLRRALDAVEDALREISP